MTTGIVKAKWSTQCKNLEKKFSRYSFDNLDNPYLWLPTEKILRIELANGFKTTFKTVLLDTPVFIDENDVLVKLNQYAVIENNSIIKVEYGNINTKRNVIIMREKLIEIKE